MLHFKHHKANQPKGLLAMAIITQDMRFRLSLIKYADNYGVSKATLEYKPIDSTLILGNALIYFLSGCCFYFRQID